MSHVPGIFDLEPTTETIPETQPAPNIRRRRFGYVLGTIVSTLAAIAAFVFILFYLQARMVRCMMSLGCTDTVTPTPIYLAFAFYLAIALFLAAIAQPIFKIKIWKACLLNVAPLVILIAFTIWLRVYRDYSWRADKLSAAKMAVYDAPAIHRGSLFAKKVEVPSGGVIIFVHVPFTVSRPVRSRSLAFLASPYNWMIKFSSRPECNYGSPDPPYGYHLVDREYSESPLPSYVSGTKIVSRQLEPNKQYYLLKEERFSPQCHLSDFDEFDPSQLPLTLTTEHAEEVIRKGGE